ncbi:MAG: InlB B-repeat-containing protein [Candidatus Nanosynbacter sp.]|nr:InlB B-repeat-containing protein [Candidatus Nanosynbacter sp.]
MKKKGFRLLLSFALVCSMLATALPAAVYAADPAPSIQTAPATRTYKVRHVRQSLDGTYNDESMAEYETLTGNVGQKTEATANRSYEGFQALVPEQVTIAPSGDITVSLYYARKEFTTYFKTGDPDQDFYETFLYGTNQSTPAQPNIPGKIFQNWEYVDESGVAHVWTPGVQPGKDMVVSAKYDVPFQASYRVNYWYQKPTDEVDLADDQKTYNLIDTEVKVQNVNTAVVYDTTARETKYMKYNSAKTAADNNGKTVSGDGETVVNVYYDRPVMTITKVYYNMDTNAEDHRESYRGIYGHSTKDVPVLDKKFRWTSPTDSQFSTENIISSFTERYKFMVDDYHIEFHARVLAPETVRKIYAVYHYQNIDGTWTRDMRKEKSLLETYSFSSFYYIFGNSDSYTNVFYYYTNSEDEFTTNVDASNPDLKPYTPNLHVDLVRNNQIIGDYDGDGVAYLHLYKKRNEFTLRFANADNNSVRLLFGTPIDSEISGISNPIKPANVPAHYVFAGWYTVSSMYDKTKLSDKATMPSRDMVLYAKWEEPHIKVTVEGNGATSALPSVIDIPKMGSVHKDLPTIPSKDGYWFAGWFKDAAFTQPFDVNESLAQDTTIYAKWVGRQQANWEIRYVDEAGRVLASSVTGTGNLYSVLFENALSIRDYAPDFASKNLTLSSANNTNVLTFVYSKIRTYWVTEDNHNLKDPEYGTKPAEKFEGYTLIRTYTAKNGDIIHLYRKNVPNTGDSANIAQFEAMLAMSALGLAALAIAKRKHS